MRYVMRLGPIRFQTGSTNAYILFGNPGIDLALEPNDKSGIGVLRSRNPGGVLACEPALSGVARELGLQVKEPPPEAIAMKAALAVTLDHGTSMDRRVSPELILELIAAVIDFHVAEPWYAFEPDEPVEIRFEPGGRRVEACVMGQAGEEFGLVLYKETGSIARVLELSARGRPEDARGLDCTTLLLANDDSCAVEPIRAMTGIAIAPVVLRMKRGDTAAVDEPEIATMVAALRAVTALAAGAVAAIGEARESQRHVVAHATRARSHQEIGPPTALDLQGVGRNEPCPCGSGRKFKRCHLGTGTLEHAPSPRPTVHDRDERIVAELLQLARRRFGAAALERGVEHAFGGRAASTQLVSPILAYEWPVEGKPLAAHFLDAPRAPLDPDDQRWIEISSHHASACGRSFESTSARVSRSSTCSRKNGGSSTKNEAPRPSAIATPFSRASWSRTIGPCSAASTTRRSRPARSMWW